MLHYSNYIVFAEMGNFDTHTFFVNDFEELEAILKTCVYGWCHKAHMKWEEGRPPKVKKLYNECMADKDFGDIATILEYNETTNSYFEWGANRNNTIQIGKYAEHTTGNNINTNISTIF